jgi:hypothetical protein
MSYSQSEGFAASAFALLGVDDLIEALDDSRPGVRKSAFSALRLKARDSRTMPADAARARDAISEYEQRKELQEQEQIARDLDRIVERAWTPDSYRDFGRIPAIRSLAKSRDPRAIEALVGIMLHGDDLSEEPRQAARDALIRIGAPAVGHLVPRLSEANPLEGVEAAYTALSKILGCERWFVDPAWEGSDLADEDLASIAALEICQGIDYHERLNPDDTYDITEFTVPVDFSPIAEHARTELTRRRSPAD